MQAIATFKVSCPVVLSYTAAVDDACDRVTQLVCHRVKYYKPYFIITLGGLS